MSTLLPYLSESSSTPQVRSTPANAYYSGGSSEAGIGLWDCWTTIRRHILMIGLLLLIALSVTGIALLIATPGYSAYAILQISPEAPRILDLNQLMNQIQNTQDYDYYKTQFELLKGEELASRVIGDLNLGSNSLFAPHTAKRNVLGLLDSGSLSVFGLLFRSSHSSVSGPRPFLSTSKVAIDNYLARLEIEPVVSTRLVRIAFNSPEPKLSALIVNTHVKDFLRLNQDLRRQADQSARSYLEQEIVQTKTKVEKSEAALNAYRSQRGILAFGITDQSKNRIAEQRMLELTTALTQAQNQRIKAEAQLEVAKTGDFDSLPTVVSNPMIENLKPEVDRLQAEYAELASKYTQKYPPLREARARLNVAKARLTAEVGLIARAVTRNYNMALDREQDLQQRIAEERQRDKELNAASLQDAILVREVETNRQLYHDELQREREISVNGDAPLPNISIVETAQVPPYPTSPKKLKYLIISGLLALVVGIALSFVLEQFDDRLKTIDEIETYLHLPELGVIPDFAKLPKKAFADSPSMAAALSANACERTGQQDIVARRSGSTAAVDLQMRFYRSIRTAILYSRAGGAPKTILVTSALPSEGKTMTAVGTALAFAHTGAGTLLIDADLRSPRCHNLLDTENVVGLSDVIVNRAQAERAIRRMDDWQLHDYQGLYLLGAGPPVPNPGELLTSIKMHDILQQLSSRYRFIVIDSAPITFSSETVGLATMVDGVVVVAGATSPKPVIRSVCKRLAEAGASVYGVVLNRVDTRQGVFHNLASYYPDLENRYGAYQENEAL